jgi:hypothetical protein
MGPPISLHPLRTRETKIFTDFQKFFSVKKLDMRRFMSLAVDDLRSSGLERLPEHFRSGTRYLDLSHNRIPSLAGAKWPEHLEALDLSCNPPSETGALAAISEAPRH